MYLTESGGERMDRRAKHPASPPRTAMENDLSEGSPNTLSLAFAEGLYADYLKDPSLVPEDWQEYFDQLTRETEFSRAPKLGPSFKTASLFNPTPGSNGNGNGH